MATAPDAGASGTAPSEVATTAPPPAQFSFPLLPDADLCERCAPLGVSLTPALLDKPTPEFVRAAFETMLVSLAGVSR